MTQMKGAPARHQISNLKGSEASSKLRGTFYVVTFLHLAGENSLSPQRSVFFHWPFAVSLMSNLNYTS